MVHWSTYGRFKFKLEQVWEFCPIDGDMGERQFCFFSIFFPREFVTLVSKKHYPERCRELVKRLTEEPEYKYDLMIVNGLTVLAKCTYGINC